MAARTRLASVVLIAAAPFVGAVGCGAKYNEANRVDGQVYYAERRMPDIGERLAHSVTHDCKGGVRDDARALALIPSVSGCGRETFKVSYVIDGIHRVEACNEQWKIRCNKTSSSRAPIHAPPVTVGQGPLDCVVECVVDDRFVINP